ncbi:hypothetical protein [Pseudoalteromonas sp. SR44-2]|uniref:capsular polysaccharide export protein, LipB/KpsS family n=1 Tax=Pseudoalteromonas sp. SR44-2 TaxID=2760937 RepID=UPI0016047BE4|nr:hypothetical protein [Pseudoalteromonas sp. SR44-2]MBB1339757.1 hypothetical protein [Pseudoalteromonas sp. SR44-2]
MKKILITVYYYDFARYFDVIAQQLKSRINCDISFVCYYPSSYYFLKKYSNWDADALYEKTQGKSKTTVDKSSHYEYTLKCRSELSGLKQKISNEANCINEYWESKLTGYDLIISSGDSRPQTTIMLELAKEKNISVLYFEQGPFRTTILDESGVNSNITFRPDFSQETNLNMLEILNEKPLKNKFFSKITKQDKLNCYKDLLYSITPNLLMSYYPIYTQTGDSLLGRIKKKLLSKKSNNKNYKLPSNYSLLALQVPSDAQMILNSKLYKDIFDLVFDVIKSMPKNLDLVIREHPLYVGRYDSRIYELINQSKNVTIDNATDLNKQIDNAKSIIVNNSTTGMDALIRGKSVVVLGDAYYKWGEICFPVYSKYELKEQIKKASEEKINYKYVNLFLEQFYNNYLLPGHFQDENIESDAVVSKIIKYIES